MPFQMTARRNHRCGHRRKADWRCARGIRRRLSQHDPRLGALTNHRAAAQIQNRTENPLPSQHLSRRTIKTRAVRRRTALVRKCVRRRPTLPRSGPRSTIGAERLSFRVRDGTGRFPLAMVAETLWRCGPRYPKQRAGTAPREPHSGRVAIMDTWPIKFGYVASPRPISTGQLHVLPRFHFRPINPVV